MSGLCMGGFDGYDQHTCQSAPIRHSGLLCIIVVASRLSLFYSCPASSGFFLAARSHGLRYQKCTRQLALEAVVGLGNRRTSKLSHRTLHKRRIRPVKGLENISFPGRISAFSVSRFAQNFLITLWCSCVATPQRLITSSF
ncbi:hypothetical protein IAS59_003624 [Cryptococcus gattii]